ncbi:MAG: ATP-binding cassette domain-containing protein [Bacteroidales bacterium]|nr:ATP-binding cassette domain-containing protein [Bacteroidales bacterium]
MRIELQHIGKKFNSEWIFRNIFFLFEEQRISAILGRNGSGKSTLLQIVAGNLHPTEGRIVYTYRGKDITNDNIFKYLAMVAPYQELIEEFTIREMLSFHFSFKSYLSGYSHEKAIDLLGFSSIKHKSIHQLSSGMKQRVKLVLALLSDVPLLLLDEPTMNLDKGGIDWYLDLIQQLGKRRTIIICSNMHQTESAFADTNLQIENY